MEKKNFYVNNLRYGTHYYEADMKMSVHVNAMPPNEAYQIPLIKEILEPMGFEPLFDEYTSEIYFQRDLGNYRVRIFPMEDRIDIIDLKYLHTVVSTKGNSLNELENYLNAIDVPLDIVFRELFNPQALEAITDFGKQYWEFYRIREERFAKFDNHFKDNKD